MNIWEALRTARGIDTQMAQGGDLFFSSMQEGGEIARESVDVLRDPEGKAIEVAPTDLGGITIEVASLNAINNKNALKLPDKTPIITDVKIARSYFWSLLISGMRESEREKFTVPGNTVAYIDHAHQAALRILATQEIEKEYRARRLRAELPVHLNVMQGIRRGAISF